MLGFLAAARNVTDWTAHPIQFGAFALVLTAICWLLFFTFVLPVAREENLADRSSLPGNRQFVAHLTGQADAIWTGKLPPTDDETFLAGRVLKLESGLAEITYFSGAKVVLEGPVTFRITGENGCDLIWGKLTARIENRRARGFAVATPSAVITDLGTEFGVEVADGAVQTHVRRGAVRIELVAERESKGEPVRVTTGQEVRIDADGIHRVSRNKQRGEKSSVPAVQVNLAAAARIHASSGSWIAGPPKHHAGLRARYGAHHVLDGDVSDRIESYWLGRSGTRDEWFLLDLGAVHRIERIELVNTHNAVANNMGTRDFEIWTAERLSSTGELFAPRQIASGTLPDARDKGDRLPVLELSPEQENLDAAPARYVRFVARTFVGQGCGLNEIRIFGENLEKEEAKPGTSEIEN